MTAPVRRASVADRAALIRMALQFIAESGYRGYVTPSPEQLERLVDYLLSLEAGAVFVAESNGAVFGMLAAVVADNHITGVRTGSEICWWVDPEFRRGGLAVELLEAAEEWARAGGALRFEMLAPAGSRIGVLYKRRGYAELETVYQRSLAA